MKFAWIWPCVLLSFIGWAVWRYDVSQAVQAFYGIDWALIGLCFGVNVGILYFRVYKWAFVFKPMGQGGSFFNMCLSLFTGSLVNMVIPLRAGGLVQAWILGKKEGGFVSRALGTVALVRVFDSIMLVFLAIMVFILWHSPAGDAPFFYTVFKTACMAGVFLLIIAAILFGFVKNSNAMDKFTQGGLRVLPERFRPVFHDAVTQFRQGLSSLTCVRYVVAGLLLSLIFWLLCAVNVFILLKAVGLNLPGIFPALLILVAQAFSMAVPAPANAGPYHAATVTVLAFYGISSVSALYTALVMHAVMFAANTFPGVLYLCLDKTMTFTMLKGIRGGYSNLR